MSLIGNITLVVVGFPRSGTSMIMRMLKLGGIEVLATGKGLAPTSDVDPHGVMELEQLSDIGNNPIEWTQGKAVKIVTPYIHYLPIDRPLKAIFIQRKISDIIISLFAKKMIWQLDIPESIELARGYLEFNKVPTLFLNYDEVMKYPRSSAIQISEFLRAKLDIDQMAKGVEEKPREVNKDNPDIPKVWESGIIKVGKDEYKDLVVHKVPFASDIGGENVPGSTPESGPDIRKETEGI